MKSLSIVVLVVVEGEIGLRKKCIGCVCCLADVVHVLDLVAELLAPLDPFKERVADALKGRYTGADWQEKNVKAGEYAGDRPHDEPQDQAPNYRP